MDHLKKNAGLIRDAGRHGDTILAHINPQEAIILKAMGGAGTINPETGLPEFGFFKSIKKAVKKISKPFQAIAVVVGNYYLPGSSLVTSQLVSKGAKKLLGSTVGKIANMASGIAGSAAGNLANYGKLLNSVGLDSITSGIDSVFNHMSNTLNELKSGFDSTTGAEFAEFFNDATGEYEQTGSAAGGKSNVGANSVANTAAKNAGISPAAPKGEDVINAGQNAGGKTGGLLQSAMDFAKKNPVPALMIGQTVASTIGGIGTAEANREQAQLNRDLQLQIRQSNMAHGAWEAPLPFEPADPSQILTMDGKYVYGPQAGQFAPGRGLGLLNNAQRR